MRRKPRLIALMLLGLGAFAGGLACGDIKEALLNAECYDHDECGPLNCSVAVPPINIPLMDGGEINNITQLGWCREGSCAVGGQPFCLCTRDAASKFVCQVPFTGYGREVDNTKPCFALDPTTVANPDDVCYCVPSVVQCAFTPSN
jgi:hypothetical protein